MGWLTTVRGLATLGMATLAGVAPAQAADLDDGWVLTDFPSPWYWHSSGAAGVAVGPDGRIVLAGGTSVYDEDRGEYAGGIAVARYNPDASLDPAFSQDGRQTTDVDGVASAYGADVLLQADGRIVVAGGTIDSRSEADFLLARYRADGSLDPSFAGDGIVTTDLGGFDRTYAAAIQPDGALVVVGESILQDGSASPWRIAVARYRADGSLDSSFGSGGVVTTDVGDAMNGDAVAIQGDGKLVVGGGHHLVRYRPDGSLDPSFGTGGVVNADTLWIRALAIQADGRIVAAGAIDGELGLARYRPGGALDPSFGVGGLQHTDFSVSGQTGATANDVAIQPNGKIVAAGQVSWYSIEGTAGSYLPVARYTTGGALDPSMGAEVLGMGPDQGAEAIAIAPSGRIFLAGAGNTWDDGYFGPQRFLLASRPGEASPPNVTTITSGPSGATNGTAPSFAFTATAAGSTFECKLDTPSGAGTYAACSSPRAYTTAADGTYTFSVRAGADSTPATRSFTVDTVAPSTSLDSGPTGSTTDDTPRFTFSSNEPGSFECRLDTVEQPGFFEPCSSPWDLGPLANGVEYSVFIRAIDAAGNVDASPAYSGLFVVDGSPPDTWIDDGPSGVTSVTAPSFTFHATLGGSTFECKLDRPTGPGSYAPCSSPQAYTTAANGAYTLTVRATSNGRTDPSPATRSFTVATTPTPTPTPAGCAATNGTDVAIPDLSTVESPIAIAGCTGNATSTATVEVHLKHTYIGDLVVSLIAPDGSAYPLHNRTGASTDDLDKTYTVNLSSEPANGTWRLRVQDAASADIGRIDTWTIDLGARPAPTPTPSPARCTATNGTDVPIADLSAVESPITVAGCAGNASSTAAVEVHLQHTYIGDLVVTLIAPDGSTYPLHNRAGGSTDNLDQTYTLNLSSEPANGTWRLRVQDAASADIGRIDAWTVTL